MSPCGTNRGSQASPAGCRSPARSCHSDTGTLCLGTNQLGLWNQTVLCSNTKMSQPLVAVWPGANHLTSLVLSTGFSTRGQVTVF